MAQREEILSFLQSYLKVTDYRDASLNGLQVEGKEEISKIVSSVDSGNSVIESAVKQKADLLIVHHGMFWGKAIALTKSHKQAIAMSFDAGLNIYASHIPLDAHPGVGNNALICNLLKLNNAEATLPYNDCLVGFVGENSEELTFSEICDTLSTLPGALNPVVTCPFGPILPKKIAVVTGSGIDALYMAEELGFDTVVTGEPKQFAYHFCKDKKLNAVCAGHYATETVGVKALGEMLASKFNCKHEFIDHPTGI